MGKNLWLAVMGLLGVFLLVIAFENAFVVQTLGILFFQADYSTFTVMFVSALMGFFIGFSFMMYSHEVQREHALNEQDEAVSASPAVTVQKEIPKVDPKEMKNDDFDEDDEVLG